MASKNRCVIKAINDLDQKAVRWPVSLRVVGKSFSGKRKDVADRAKHQVNKHLIANMSVDEPFKN